MGIHALLGATIDKNKACDGDEWSKGVQAGHNVEKVVKVLPITGSEPGRVNKQVLLSIDDRWTDFVLLRA